MIISHLAQNMSNFLKQVFSVKVDTRLYLERSKLDVIEHLCHGNCVLVPYDAGPNYEVIKSFTALCANGLFQDLLIIFSSKQPCLKEGKRAHWATICGFCVVTDKDPTCIPIDQVNCKVVEFADNRSVIHVEPQSENAKNIFHFVKGLLAKASLFVYARQGKSRRIQIWSFEQLCKSNRNISKVSSKIIDDPARVQMVYPENGDLTKSLANQFIMIYKWFLCYITYIFLMLCTKWCKIKWCKYNNNNDDQLWSFTLKHRWIYIK